MAQNILQVGQSVRPAITPAEEIVLEEALASKTPVTKEGLRSMWLDLGCSTRAAAEWAQKWADEIIG